MNITFIIISALITFSFLSAVLVLAALALSSQGSYWGQEVGQELIPAWEADTIHELHRETAPVA